MKNQTIEVDFTVMLYAGVMYTGLVISGWLLVRLTIACFKLPSILNATAELQGPEDDGTTSMLPKSTSDEGELSTSRKDFS